MRQKTAKAARKLMRREEGRIVDRFKGEVRSLPFWRRVRTGLQIAAGGPVGLRIALAATVGLLVAGCWAWVWLLGRVLG